MKILVTGMNHRTAPLEVRERFAVEEPAALLRTLVEGVEIDEAVVVSTCNRVELVAIGPDGEAVRQRLHHCFNGELGGPQAIPSGSSLDDFLYELNERQAMRHVLRVASSIDSMVVGEPQILGQMKDAYRAAVECGACGPVLSRLFQSAFATAKRVRNETRIAEGSVSVARVAVDLAKQIFERLDQKTAVLIGAGEMIESALHALRQEGLGSVLVANRTRSRAVALAERFGATPHGLDELDTLIAGADVLLSSIAGDGYLLDADRVSRALATRRQRPLFLIDIGVPRNVDPAVNEITSAFLYDLDDLQQVAIANADRRREETSRAEEIVLDEERRFDAWLVALQAVPTIRRLRGRAETVRQAELERILGRLELSDAQRESFELVTRAIVNKILHAPIARLRAESNREDGLAMLQAAHALFALDDPSAPGAHADEALDDDQDGEDSAEGNDDDSHRHSG